MANAPLDDNDADDNVGAAPRSAMGKLGQQVAALGNPSPNPTASPPFMRRGAGPKLARRRK